MDLNLSLIYSMTQEPSLLSLFFHLCFLFVFLKLCIRHSSFLKYNNLHFSLLLLKSLPIVLFCFPLILINVYRIHPAISAFFLLSFVPIMLATLNIPALKKILLKCFRQPGTGVPGGSFRCYRFGFTFSCHGEALTKTKSKLAQKTLRELKLPYAFSGNVMAASDNDLLNSGLVCMHLHDQRH